MRLTFLSFFLLLNIACFGQRIIEARDTLRYFQNHSRGVFSLPPDSTLVLINEAIAAYPNDTSLQYNKGVVLFRAKRYKEVLQVFKPLQPYLERYGLIDLLGEAYYVNGHEDTAFIYFRKQLRYLEEKVQEMGREGFCPGHECDGLKLELAKYLKLLDNPQKAGEVLNSISTRDKWWRKHIRKSKKLTKADILKAML